METITQTNRTILFAEINPERLNLLTLVGDVRGKSSLDDDKIKEINEELLVSSFEEFLEKFTPVVYSWCDAATGTIQYSLTKPENIPQNCITEILLNESNDLLNMLTTLMSARDAQGVANADFQFSNILEMISPKKIMDDIRQVRREIQYTYSKYVELDEEDPKRLDLGDKLNYQFEQASQNYNNVLAMLPLAIEDINTAYENFFTARDAVTAAGERVAAADEAVCLAEKKYMNGEISVEEWEATLQELSDAQVAETAANENYEAAAAGAQAAAEAVEAKKQELRDSRVNDTAYVVHCARIECPFGMRESYLALDATHGVLTHQIPQMTVKDMILNTNIINFGGCHSRENPDVQAEIEKTNAIIESKKDWRDDVVGYFTKKWNERVTIIKAGIGLAKKLLGMKKKEKTEEEKLEEMSSDFVGECKAQFPADGEWLEGHEKVFINGEPLLLRRCSIMCSYGGCVTILLSGQPE